jgi:hypothetical protein
MGDLPTGRGELLPGLGFAVRGQIGLIRSALSGSQDECLGKNAQPDQNKTDESQAGGFGELKE